MDSDKKGLNIYYSSQYSSIPIIISYNNNLGFIRGDLSVSGTSIAEFTEIVKIEGPYEISVDVRNINNGNNDRRIKIVFNKTSVLCSFIFLRGEYSAFSQSAS